MGQILFLSHELNDDGEPLYSGNTIKIFNGDDVYKLDYVNRGAVVETLVSSFLDCCVGIPSHVDYSFCKVKSHGILHSASKSRNFAVESGAERDYGGGAKVYALRFRGSEYSVRSGHWCSEEETSKQLGISNLGLYTRISYSLRSILADDDSTLGYVSLLKVGQKYRLAPLYDFESCLMSANVETMLREHGCLSIADIPEWYKNSIDSIIDEYYTDCPSRFETIRIDVQKLRALIKYAKERPGEAISMADAEDREQLKFSASLLEYNLSKLKGTCWKPVK